MKKRQVVFDCEIYKNFFFVCFRYVDTGKVVRFERSPGVKLDRAGLRRMLKENVLIGFNSLNFDLPVVWLAVLGASTAELKEAANAIIVDGLKPWDLEREFDFKIPKDIDMIDLIETTPGAKIGLKIYAGRMHAQRIQDLPIDPEAELTPEEMDITADYCENSDIPATLLLFDRLKGQLDLRYEMGREYKADLRSKSEPQIAEAVIKKKLTDLTGDVPRRPKIKPGTRFKYKVPDYIEYRHPALREMLEDVRSTYFTVDKTGGVKLPKVLHNRKIRIRNSVYRMGIGGLHSSEEGVSYVADERTKIIDRDVASYYPNIILTLGLYPKHLGKAFLRVYGKIIAERLAAKERVGAAKKAGKKADPADVIEMESKKIVGNGLFGKLGSKWSIVYSPDLMIQVTLTGQLSLLMKIDRLEHAGFEVISANTDGIVTLVPRDREHEFNAIVKQWERDTGFETEATEYASLHSQSVNAYIAIKPDGSIKTKGSFANPWWEKAPDSRGQFMTSPKNTICTEAVVEYLTNGTAIEETILNCRDIRKFVAVRKVAGGALWLSEGGGAIADGERIGKTVRFYHSVATRAPLYYGKPHPKTGNYKRVAKSEGAVPCNVMPGSFPNDMDFDWYINEAREMLEDIGFRGFKSAKKPDVRAHLMSIYC